MDFIDDVDFVARAAGTILDILANLADLIDPAIACAIDFEDVDVFAGSDALANLAGITRSGRRPAHTVEGLGQDPRRGGLADAARPGKQVGVGDTVTFECVHQGLSHWFLPDQVRKLLRSIAPGQNRSEESRVGKE